MTISDKIRIYELSRDLNLENKDILDAAQKLSISVKSHSSSISAEDAKKIKNLINKKNSDKEILSINKPSFKKDNNKQSKKENSKNKTLLIKPVMRICISCRKTFDRKNLLKITKDHKQGVMFHKGIGRSAYVCQSKKCYSDSKIKKKLQKALKTFLEAEFIEIFEKEIQSYNDLSNKGI